MIKLKSLTFNNIRSFVEEQTIVFEDMGKLIQIDGINNDDGGSSGAGKTSIFLSLDYLLGLNDIASTVLQSRLTKKTIEVTGLFEIDGKEVKISRSKKKGLLIEEAEGTVSGSSKLAEERLDELIGIPRKLFKKMVHKKQEERGFFLSLTAKEMYDFLIKVLGLEDCSKQVERIDIDIKKTNEQLNAKKSVIPHLQQQIDEYKEILSNKEKPEAYIKKEDNFNDLPKLKEKRELLIQSYESDKGSIKRPKEMSVSVKEEKENLKLLEDSLKGFEYELTQIQIAKERVGHIKNSIIELNKDKERIEKAECPTCSQIWSGESAVSKLNSINKKIKDMIDEALVCKKNLDKEDEVVKNIDKIKSISNNLRSDIKNKKSLAENDKLKKENEYNKKIKEIDDKYMLTIKEISDTIVSIESDIRLEKEKERSYKLQLDSWNKETKELKDKVTSKTKDLKDSEESIKLLEERLNIAEESKRSVKTYTLQTFQDTLSLIGDMATNIMGNISNMSNSSIYFESCKETKSGKIKDEVNAIINKAGSNEIPIKSLSGGERTTIDLAIDLAVIDIIESKTGKGADFFIVDEPFRGLDPLCKENCLEMLKQIDTNKRIIMVDHGSELKAMVSEVITVSKSGESSRILN